MLALDEGDHLVEGVVASRGSEPVMVVGNNWSAVAHSMSSPPAEK